MNNQLSKNVTEQIQRANKLLSNNSMSLLKLKKLQDTLLNEATADLYLEAVLNNDVYEFNDVINPEKDTLQRNLIRKALVFGADPKIFKQYVIRIEILDEIKELLLKHPIYPLNASDLLELVIQCPVKSSSEEDTKISLLNYVIHLGADINTEILVDNFITNSLEIAERQRNFNIISFLKAHGAKCSIYSDIAKDFFKQEIFTKHPFGFENFYEAIHKNLDAPKSETNKIPPITHSIWLTSPLSPQEIPSDDVKIIIENKNILAQGNTTWKHIVWTNNKSLIPNSVSTLEEHNITVREIKELQKEILLFDYIMKLIDNKLWGMASDILRYSIMYHFGGVYKDLDFKFTLNIENELYKYDFLAISFVNYFFAAKPEHPIVATIIDKVALNLSNPPSYIQSIDTSNILYKTMYITLFPFGLAYLEKSNQENNTDIIYPHIINSMENDMQNEKWLTNNYECVDAKTFIEDFNLYYNICTPKNVLLGHDIGHDAATGQHLTWLSS